MKLSKIETKPVPPPIVFNLGLTKDEAVYLQTVCYHVNSLGKIGKFFESLSDILDSHGIEPKSKEYVDKSSSTIGNIHFYK